MSRTLLLADMTVEELKELIIDAKFMIENIETTAKDFEGGVQE